MFSSLSFFWFFRQTKDVFFYLYLWQLKEYHIGKFLAYFQSEKGKQIFSQPLNILKIILLLYFFFVPILFMFVVILLYIAEFFKIVADLARAKIKRPTLTKMVFFLILSVLFFEGLLFFVVFKNTKEDIVHFSFWLLILDILTPLIVSFIVIFSRFLVISLKNLLKNEN